jgi:hypothetical protein
MLHSTLKNNFVVFLFFCYVSFSYLFPLCLLLLYIYIKLKYFAGSNNTSPTTTPYPLMPYQVPTKPTKSPYSVYEEVNDWDSVDEPQPTRSQSLDRGYCTQSMFFYNVKLAGGLQAGTILINTFANNMHECVRLCCEDISCDIALMRKDECFTMHCPTERCTVVEGGEFQISFVARQGRNCFLQM